MIRFKGMNLFDAIAQRYSVRSFQDRPVEREKLLSIFSAVRLAPSARNAQEWRFIVVTDPVLREEVAQAGGQPFLRQCPVIVVACAVTDRRLMRCGEMAYPIDVAIAIDHLTLAATAMGLGTCWIGSFDPEPVRKTLGIPSEVPVVELVALGYPAGEGPAPQNKSRLPLEEILWENGWQQPFR
ncbi:MAG TPA: nitroreductase family protein [Termitinemataceae bacterium]|nr:nitroreductase family protein [Termitinemataceae bacterium]HOM24196.1 nitroreductase family protein [Termitinemataceae bacterium]HPQ01239.1 nitroreductase family protein [Termitinemataceae bacterium]